MTKAIQVLERGDPDVMKLVDVAVGDPGPGEIRLRHTAIGVNFIDTYHRRGLYPVAPPFTPGLEAVGTVTAIGENVRDLKVGDRVAYGNGPIGGYAEERLIPAASVVQVPPALKDDQISGMMLRGLTVWYLVRALHPLKAGETVLFHAAAGGVGLIFCQWAKAIGATVIGTAGTEEKAALARRAGCDHVILYRTQDWVKRLREIAPQGVSVVYDGVGKDTFMGSLDCLAHRGLMVSFGNASGAVPPFDPLLLSAKGSLFVTRPKLADYVAKREDLVRACAELFDVVASGKVAIKVGQRFRLAEAVTAHRALESRETIGSTILIP